MAFQVKERLYVDKNGKVYTQDELTERSEVSLLMTAGGELSDADAKKYGLVTAEPVADDDDEYDEDDTEGKAVSGPPANKARSVTTTKASGA